MPKRARPGLTRTALNTLLNAAVCDGYICFAFQVTSDGLWRPGVTILIDGDPAGGMDIRETYNTRPQALAAAYRAACERRRLIWTYESVRPVSKN
jgi:hypothetical protein